LIVVGLLVLMAGGFAPAAITGKGGAVT